ncbi:MAG: endolytic transglycosylase MltG [Porphyromonadaceae bacterium]|nr:MAG: endolytic transglycosylase MltG [Porphyromonadaceae bacterium]
MPRKKLLLKGGLIGGALVILLLVTGGSVLYTWIYSPSLTKPEKDSVYFFVRTGSQYPQVYMDFKKSGWLKYDRGFDWVAKRKEYPGNIKPGRYLLLKGMSNSQIVDILRSGRQAEVNLVFNTTRYFDRMAGVISKQIEADSAALIKAFRDTLVMCSFGFTPDQWRTMFLPNTYRFLWNTNAEQFLERMNQEFKAFWNPARESRLKEIGLDKFQLMSLAAIVQEETFKPEDMPIVAGVYMNRIKKGIRLQADPTVIYALGDYSIKRVLHNHLTIDSPYNTYKYAGLPPGPIRIPSVQAIDACLNYQKHDYLYFCAKEDFSGYSVFARSYSEHLANARKYQRALDRN